MKKYIFTESQIRKILTNEINEQKLTSKTNVKSSKNTLTKKNK
jgi:hypothetical protein